MENLYDYLFHFNHHTGYWNAFRRSDNDKYFNGTLQSDVVIKNKDIDKIIKQLSKK